jgi:hypothetical protein
MSKLKTVGLNDSCGWPPVEGRYRPTRSALRLHVAIVILLAYLACGSSLAKRRSQSSKLPFRTLTQHHDKRTLARARI